MTVVIVVGVTGAGKSTVGKLLAVKLGAQFIEGDQLQPLANARKMAAGDLLTDLERLTWLHALGQRADELARSGLSAVFTCLALKRVFRDAVREECPTAQFVLLDAEYGHIMARVVRRGSGAGANRRLIESQFAVLEPLAPSEPGITLSTNASPDLISERARSFVAY